MWVHCLGKMQNFMPFKAMVHNPGSRKDCEILEISNIYAACILQKWNFKNKLQNCLDIYRYVQSHSNKKAACQYWTILVTLYSHLLCTVMIDNFSRFSLVTKAPISFVICVCLALCLFYYPSVCPSTSTSVRLFVRLSALYAPLPLERFAWNLI
jgi:hypothetical protein